MACGANPAWSPGERLTGFTAPFWTSSPSQSWAPTMTSGPVPALLTAWKSLRTSVETWTATVIPLACPNWVAYVSRIGFWSWSHQMTRSTLASRTGAAVVTAVEPAVLVLLVLVVADEADEAPVVGDEPPHAPRSSTAPPVKAAPADARLPMDSPSRTNGQGARPTRGGREQNRSSARDQARLAHPVIRS